MKRTFNFLMGALLGGLIGAAVAILIAPSSGEQIRANMMSRAKAIRSDVAQAAADRRKELERQLASLRSPQGSNQ